MDEGTAKCEENARYSFLLGSALRNEDTEQFLQVYDAIVPKDLPSDEVDRIKELARKIADLPECEFNVLKTSTLPPGQAAASSTKGMSAIPASNKQTPAPVEDELGAAQTSTPARPRKPSTGLCGASGKACGIEGLSEEHMDDMDDQSDSGVFNSSKNTTGSTSDDTEMADEYGSRGVFNYFPQRSQMSSNLTRKMENIDQRRRNDRAYDDAVVVADSDGDDMGDNGELTEVVVDKGVDPTIKGAIEMKTFRMEATAFSDPEPDKYVQNMYRKQQNALTQSLNDLQYDEAVPVEDDDDDDTHPVTYHQGGLGRKVGRFASMQREDSEDYEAESPDGPRVTINRRLRSANQHPKASDGVRIEQDVRQRTRGPPFGDPVNMDQLSKSTERLMCFNPPSSGQDLKNMPTAERIRNSMVAEKGQDSEGNSTEAAGKKKKKKKKNNKDEGDEGNRNQKDSSVDINGNPMTERSTASSSLTSTTRLTSSSALNHFSSFPKSTEHLNRLEMNGQLVADLEDLSNSSKAERDQQKQSRATRRRNREAAQMIKSEHIEGFRGDTDAIEDLLDFIESGGGNGNNKKKKKVGTGGVVNGNNESILPNGHETNDIMALAKNGKKTKQSSGKNKVGGSQKDSEKSSEDTSEKADDSSSGKSESDDVKEVVDMVVETDKKKVVEEKAEVKASTPEVKASTPEVKASTPEVKASTPEVKASTPEVKASIPEVKASTPEVKSSTTEVKASTPEVKASTTEVKASTTEVKASTPEVKASTPEVKASNPEVKASTPEVKASTPEVKASTPEVKASTPEVQAKSPAPTSLHGFPSSIKDFDVNDVFIFTDFENVQPLSEGEFKVVTRKKAPRSQSQTCVMGVSQKDFGRDGSYQHSQVYGGYTGPLFASRDDRFRTEDRPNMRRTRPIVRSVTPPPSATNPSAEKDHYYYQDKPTGERAFSPSAFPALGGMRRNSTGDVPSAIEPDDSDLESVKSLPLVAGSASLGARAEGTLSPIMSYAKIAAGPKTANAKSNQGSGYGAVAAWTAEVKPEAEALPETGRRHSLPSLTDPMLEPIVSEPAVATPPLSVAPATHSVCDTKPDSQQRPESEPETETNTCPKTEKIISNLGNTAKEASRTNETAEKETRQSQEQHQQQQTQSSRSDSDISHSKEVVPIVVNENSIKRTQSDHTGDSFRCSRQRDDRAPMLTFGSNVNSDLQGPILPILDQKEFPAITEVGVVTRPVVAAPSQSSKTLAPVALASQPVTMPQASAKTKVSAVAPAATSVTSTPAVAMASPSTTGSNNNKKQKNKSVVFLDRRSRRSTPNLGISFGFDTNFEAMATPATGASGGAVPTAKSQSASLTSSTVVTSLVQTLAASGTEIKQAECGFNGLVAVPTSLPAKLSVSVVTSTTTAITENKVVPPPPNHPTQELITPTPVGEPNAVIQSTCCPPAPLGAGAAQSVVAAPTQGTDNTKRVVNIEKLMPLSTAVDPNFARGRFAVEEAASALKRQWDSVMEKKNRDPGKVIYYSNQ